ncbi:hypothetical protein [Psychrobacter aquaticus]|uniref:Uncharacterized protein n=1 Tax=Psychrobacter aquaticus CMS 56 TaxID=1354303 RepID=U4T6H6_9GAMM|nr:hypothetical protein [Psychrobacter aquaticus]ERL56997.1 hypothetical protein M917_0194 [Psychrobacter aquaticus CMS 56]
MSDNKEKTLQDYRHLVVSKDITVHLSQDQQAMILKTYDYGLNALTDIDEMLLSAVIRQLKMSIQPDA